MSLTTEQLALRRTGVTSTDIAAIAGINPYRSALEVYMDKTKPDWRGEEGPESEPCYWGLALEPPVTERYERDHTNLLLEHPGTVRSIRQEWMLATPDRIVLGKDADGVRSRWGLEVKTAFSPAQVARWGEGGDQMPEEYLIQCAWCMAVCELARWDLAVLLGGYHGLEYREYRLTRDREFERGLVEGANVCTQCSQAVERGSERCPACEYPTWAGARHFWFEHVLKGVSPSPDGSPGAGRALRALYPEAEARMVLADPECEGWIDWFADADERMRGAAKTRAYYQQLTQGYIGPAEGVEGEWGRITWKVTKDGKRVWNARGLRPPQGKSGTTEGTESGQGGEDD